MLDVIGWTATALFASSYFFKERRAILGIQLFAALLWIGYGTLMGALPVVVSNAAVALSATWGMFRSGVPEDRVSSSLS